MKKQTVTVSLLIVLLTITMLTVTATAEEPFVNVQEGDILPNGETFGLVFDPTILPENPLIIVGIIPEEGSIYSGRWQLLRDDCSPEIFGLDIQPGHYAMEMIIFERSSFCGLFGHVRHTVNMGIISIFEEGP